MNAQQQHVYTALGLMSGTSLDGLDLALCRFGVSGDQWSYEILATGEIPYPKDWADRLQEAIHASAIELAMLDRDYGRWLGRQVLHFLDRHPAQLACVASHGHTIHHRPQEGLTIQVGHGRALADTCGQIVVSDFRTRDVLYGGQGAPLVPVGDQLLFGEYAACLNLGGFSNVSFWQDGQRRAYDIGFVNIVLNDLARRVGRPYDQNGDIARSGQLDSQLLNQLEALPYYQRQYPKSTGYEWILEEVLPLFRESETPIADQMHTAVVHIARRIGSDLAHHLGHKGGTVLVTGGGACHSFLLEQLQQQVPGAISLYLPPAELIHFKEALVFAFMGVLRLRGAANCLASVTGAQMDVSGGEIYA